MNSLLSEVERRIAEEDRAAAKFDPARHSEFRASDTGNAELFAALNCADLRYCKAWGEWLVWNGTHWAADQGDTPLRATKGVLQTILGVAAQTDDDAERKRLVNHAKKSESASKRQAILTLAKAEDGIPIRPEQLDTDPWLLNCRNCTLDLRSGMTTGHRREDFITRRLDVEYHPEGSCPTWLAFLDRIFAGNKNLIRFVQKAIGYALTGDVSEQCFFILHGTGQNGKSTLLNVLLDLLGDAYAIQAAPDLLLQKKGNHPTELADLRGTRAVVSVETDDGRRIAEGLVKQLTGGDRIRARFLHQNFFQFKPTFKLFLATNHKPQIRGTDHAIWRRIRLIPFTVTIPKAEQDKKLDEKLRAELPGILHWAVEGCMAWQEEGLNPPDSVIAATEGYRCEMDVLAAFISECCLVSPEAKATAKALYATYRDWCEENGERAETQRSFGMRLSERGFNRTRYGTGYVWHGLGLLSNGVSEPSSAFSEPCEPDFNKVSSKISRMQNNSFSGSHGSHSSLKTRDSGVPEPFVDVYRSKK